MFDKKKDPGPVYPATFIYGMAKLFDEKDKDGNGLTAEEIKTGFPQGADNIWKWLTIFDENKDQRVTLAEFWKVFMEKEKEHDFPAAFEAKLEE